MFTKKELGYLLVATLILTFVISLAESLKIFIFTSITILTILLLNAVSKKIVARHLDAEIEIDLWKIKRYGFKAHKQLKNFFHAGLVLPIITTALTFGYIYWMAPFVFDVKAKVHRAAKRHGLYTFSEMTEYHTGLIAATGIVITLLSSLVGYTFGFQTFSKLSVLYAFYNILPISDLDGNKIFFGSVLLWSFLASLTLIGLFFAIFII